MERDEMDIAAYELTLEGEWRAAAEAFRECLRLFPENARARQGLAISLLGDGQYPEGFALYARRYEAPGSRPRPQMGWPEWKGEPVAGKRLLLLPEQGLGDQIQYARFAPILRDMGADVTLLCAPELSRLFARLGVRVPPPSGGDFDIPAPDFWCFSLDLPARLGVTIDTVPPPAHFALPMASGGGVGLMRRGNPQHANDRQRSIPDDVTIPFDTQALWPEATGARDMMDTAEIIARLDVVVSVDTAVAHLAASMGKPTVILLPARGCDWRWMSGRSNSPWYPSVKLVRQSRPGEWGAVLDQVRSLIL
jgi:hypothetical protein